MTDVFIRDEMFEKACMLPRQVGISYKEVYRWRGVDVRDKDACHHIKSYQNIAHIITVA